MPPGRPDGFVYLDYRADGKLAAQLRRWRGQQESYETIARRLRDLYDSEVTASTVRRWCRNLDIPSAAAS